MSADALDAKTILVRASELVVHIYDAHAVQIEREGVTITAPPIALSMLDAFATPQAVGDILERFAVRGVEHFMEASAVIVQLARAGVLRAPGDRGSLAVRGFVAPAIHIAMLDDHARTLAFCKGIDAATSKEDVVVEIGVGTGVLSVRAATAGAKHVYGIEETGIADLAERVFEANGVRDRITLVRGRSTQVDLPERGNVLVTETIGNDPLDEGILEIVADAKRRLLVPGARIVPAALEVWALLVDVPRAVFERHVFTPDRLAAYRASYGIDFAPLAAHHLGPTQPIMVKSEEALRWERVADPVRVAAIDFASEYETVLEEHVSVVARAPARTLGTLLLFRATLAEGITLSTLPGEVDPKNSWKFAFWPAFDRLAVAAGDAIEITYMYRRGETIVRIG
jgi:hypothetical protein